MMTIPIAKASSVGLLFYLFLHTTICSSSATTSVDLSGGNAAAEVIVKDFTNHQFATKGLPHPSEQCLTTSVAMMTQWSSEKTREGIVDSGKHYCASMTVEQRELLALELTNCQLVKQRRSIFRHRKFSDLDQDQSASLVSGDSTGNDDDHIDDGSIENLCPIGTLSAGSPYKPTNCLPFLSEYASLIYNQFYLYTDEICGRLTESLIIQHKEEVSRMLVNASSSVAQHIQLQSILLKDHSLAMQEQQSQLQRIYESRKLQEEEILHIIQANYIQMKEQFLESEQIFRERERESEQMYLRTLSDLEKMLQMTSKASSHIQLLSSIESFVFAAISGLSVLKSFVVFILCMNVAWILTALTSTQRARRYIAGIVTAEFSLEVSIVLLVDSPVLFGLDDEILIKLARYLAWGSCGLVLASFLVASFFMTYPKDDFEAISVEDFLQKHISELSNLNEARGLALACRAMGNNLDVGRERLENRFNQYHKKPRYQIRRYKPRHRTISDRCLPVVTPAKQKRTPSPGLLPTSDQVQDPFSFSTKRTSKPINHREHINMNDTSDSNYVNSSSDESSDSENYETLESKTVNRKRKLSNLESSNEDDDSFRSTRSSLVSTQNSIETKEGGSVSSITMGEDFSNCGKRRRETRD